MSDPTLLSAWNAARARLTAAGVDSPVIDARLLLEAASGASRADIIADPHRALTPDQAATLDGYLERRGRREPVGRILGRQGFWRIMLSVTPHVLSPRSDTEVIVDLALKAFGETQAFDMADLGTGSGAILLAVLNDRPRARGVGTDVSEDALAVAKENAANLDLNGRATFLRTSWGDGLAGEAFDLVVSNPPYVASAVIDTLDAEVREHDPRLALDGGPDGLDAYRVLAAETLRLLKPAGVFALEVGYDQAAAVTALMREAGAQSLRTAIDHGGRDRVVTGAKKPLGAAGTNA